MAGINRFNLRGAQIHYENAGEQIMDLSQMGSVSFKTGTSKYDVIPAGQVDIEQVMMSHADPMVEIGTPDIYTVLFHLPASLNGRELYTGELSHIEFAERDNAGTFLSTGTNYLDMIISNGVFFLDSISVQQDDPKGAQATMQLHLLAPDALGLTRPVSINKLAVQTADPAFNTCYYLAPTYFDAVRQDGVLGWTYNTNINFTKDRFDGEVYPLKGAISTRGATLSVRFANFEHLITGGFLANLDQGCILSPGIELYLRQADQCGTRVADNVSNHIYIQLPEAVYDINDLSATDNEDGTVTVDFRILGTPIVSVAQTIPKT